MLTLTQLQRIVPNNPYVNKWHEVLSKLLPEYNINTPKRISAFLSQCVHESGEFTILVENLNYTLPTLRKVFPKYFPTDNVALLYINKPNKQEAIANRVYANRMGNGDEASGDGFRYRGRGLIQITGKNNYQAFADSVETDISMIPDYLETFEGAVQSACWFWESNNLNRFADVGDIVGLSKAINGGLNGLDSRLALYKKVSQIIGA